MYPRSNTSLQICEIGYKSFTSSFLKIDISDFVAHSIAYTDTQQALP
jgi:hypothetical protein